MARSPLILAAVATSAVSGFEATRVAPLGSGNGPFESALVADAADRALVVRVPRTQAAEAQQSADLIALRALTAGIRDRLPFAVTTAIGQAPIGPTRAVVYEHLAGSKTTLAQLGHDAATSIGEAIAAIHNLPTSLVTDAGLPASTPGETRREALTVVDDAIATGLLPLSLRQRWMRAVEDVELWQYSPVVVNSALSTDSFFVSPEGRVVGVLGWHALRLGDPARDLAWLLGAPGDGVVDTVLGSYARHRGSVDHQLRARAELLSELELANWLLHGIRTHSTEIVDDAVEMMSRLVDRISQNDTASIRKPSEVLDVDQVEELLDRRVATG